MSTCTITPVSAFQSTNLNSKIDCFGRLADRIVRTLGAPLVTVELHQDQLYENISIACEMFTRFAGYTREYLIFDSNLYEPNIGMRLDLLYTLSNTTLTQANRIDHKTQSLDTAPYVVAPTSVYISNSAINGSFFSTLSTINTILTAGLFVHQILDSATYNTILSAFAASTTLSSTPMSGYFNESYLPSMTMGGDCVTKEPAAKYNNMFDYDTMDYRKVIDVTDFEEGSSTGINTLFTIEQTLAQQTYFSYAMGNYGFDLISWYTLKDWLKTREKMLATKRSYSFDDRTQYLRMYPQPTSSSRFYGVVCCYVERPIRDIIKEFWVYQYALALCKLTLASVRGKFGTVALFGGQIFDVATLREANNDKANLEKQLYEGAAAAGGSVAPPEFFIG